MLKKHKGKVGRWEVTLMFLLSTEEGFLGKKDSKTSGKWLKKDNKGKAKPEKNKERKSRKVNGSERGECRRSGKGLRKRKWRQEAQWKKKTQLSQNIQEEITHKQVLLKENMSPAAGRKRTSLKSQYAGPVGQDRLF